MHTPLLKIKWLIIFLFLIVSACSSPAPAPTPTPTKVIGAVEITQAGPDETTISPIGSTCLDHPSQDAQKGPPCLHGTFEAHYDITTQVNNHETDHVTSPLSVQFSLWDVQPGILKGSAHLTHSLHATMEDTEALGCKLSTEIADPFEWDVQLNGQYFARPDGSIQVIFQATPAQGPAYPARFEDCPIPDRQEPGVNWSALSGKLMNGVYDFRQDNPLPANSTGEFYTIIHMELATNP
jgi:hypothetical protein